MARIAMYRVLLSFHSFLCFMFMVLPSFAGVNEVLVTEPYRDWAFLFSLLTLFVFFSSLVHSIDDWIGRSFAYGE